MKKPEVSAAGRAQKRQLPAVAGLKVDASVGVLVPVESVDHICMHYTISRLTCLSTSITTAEAGTRTVTSSAGWRNFIDSVRCSMIVHYGGGAPGARQGRSGPLQARRCPRACPVRLLLLQARQPGLLVLWRHAAVLVAMPPLARTMRAQENAQYGVCRGLMSVRDVVNMSVSYITNEAIRGQRQASRLPRATDPQ